MGPEENNGSNDLEDELQADEEIARLEAGVRQIVTTRERTPRAPQWSRAWWRTLVKYNRQLARLRRRDR